MKSIIVSLVSVVLMSSVVLGDEVTVCGKYDNRPHGGLIAVQVDVLDNVTSPEELAGQTIGLFAAGSDFDEVYKKAELIDSLEEGTEYCITGILKEKGLIPNEIENR